MKFIHLIAFILGMSLIAHSQYRYDYQWMLDGNFNQVDSTQGNYGLVLDFNGDTIELYNQKLIVQDWPDLPWDTLNNIYYSNNLMSYSNTDSDLSFYNNYCSLRTYDPIDYICGAEELSPNGSALRANESILYQYGLFLPSSLRNTGYYFYGSVSPAGPIVSFFKSFYICDLSLSQDDTELRNCKKIMEDSLYSSGIGAVKHSNNMDWWIVKFRKYPSDVYVFKLSDEQGGISDTLFYENIAPYGAPTSGQFTSIKFNPQGTQMAISAYTQSCPI